MERLNIEAFEDGHIAVTRQRLTPTKKITGDHRKKSLGDEWQRTGRIIVRPGKPVPEEVAHLFQPGQNQEDLIEIEQTTNEGRALAEKAVQEAEAYEAHFQLNPPINHDPTAGMRQMNLEAQRSYHERFQAFMRKYPELIAEQVHDSVLLRESFIQRHREDPQFWKDVEDLFPELKTVPLGT